MNEENKKEDKKQLEIKHLKGSLIFQIAPLISKLNIKSEINNLKDNNIDTMEKGLLFFDLVFKNLNKCENEVYSILATVTGEDINIIKNLDLDELLGLIKALITNEKFQKAFSSLLQ